MTWTEAVERIDRECRERCGWEFTLERVAGRVTDGPWAHFQLYVGAVSGRPRNIFAIPDEAALESAVSAAIDFIRSADARVIDEMIRDIEGLIRPGTEVSVMVTLPNECAPAGPVVHTTGVGAALVPDCRICGRAFDESTRLELPPDPEGSCGRHARDTRVLTYCPHCCLTVRHWIRGEPRGSVRLIGGDRLTHDDPDGARIRTHHQTFTGASRILAGAVESVAGTMPEAAPEAASAREGAVA